MKKNILFLLLCCFYFPVANSLYDSNLNPFTFQSHYQIDFSWEKFEETDIYANFNIDKTRRNDQNSLIPNVIPLLENLGKEKINKLIEKNLVQIYGAEFFCESYISHSCVYDRKKLETNMEVFKNYRLYSTSEKNIEVTVYPFSPQIYDYDSYYIWEEKNSSSGWVFSKSPKLTFFDTTGEFFGVKMNNLKEFSTSWSIHDYHFTKEYTLLQTKAGNYMYIPYYTAIIPLQKWENIFRLQYKKYVAINPDSLWNIRIKLK